MTTKRTTRNNAVSLSSQTELSLCQFAFADRRRCRMLRRDHPSLCPFHARAEQQLLESHQIGSEISATLSGDFLTATDINFVLGKLFTAVAQDRLPVRNAALLAYIGQLLLHSLSGVKQEFKFRYDLTAGKNSSPKPFLSPNRNQLLRPSRLQPLSVPLQTLPPTSPPKTQPIQPPDP